MGTFFMQMITCYDHLSRKSCARGNAVPAAQSLIIHGRSRREGRLIMLIIGRDEMHLRKISGDSSGSRACNPDDVQLNIQWLASTSSSLA